LRHDYVIALDTSQCERSIDMVDAKDPGAGTS